MTPATLAEREVLRDLLVGAIGLEDLGGRRAAAFTDPVLKIIMAGAEALLEVDLELTDSRVIAVAGELGADRAEVAALLVELRDHAALERDVVPVADPDLPPAAA